MQEIVREFVVQTGEQLLGVGSWISGNNFRPGSSDFDLRLVIPTNADPAALRRWGEAQDRLRSMIEQRFGAEAPSVLRRTNLYAPRQLMEGVTKETAADRFHQLQRVPNLSHRGPVPDRVPERYVEGLFGKGSTPYTQGYEKKAGRLFYNNGGRAATGFTDLVHLTEGVGRYSVQGSANTAWQWAHKGLHAIENGNAADLLKYLRRVDVDLAKCRDMSRFAMDHGYRAKLKMLADKLEASSSNLYDPYLAAEAKNVLLRAKAETAILANYQNAGPLQKAYYTVMMDGIAAKNQIGSAVNRVTSLAPDLLTMKNAFRFLVIASATGSAATAAGEGDWRDGAQAFFGSMKFSGIGLGPAVLAEMIFAIRGSAVDAGIALIGGRQDPWDLISGVYTPFGGGIDPKASNRTLDDLLRIYKDEERLRTFVLYMAHRAAVKEGERTARVISQELRMRDHIFSQCWPMIFGAWQFARELLMTEYVHLRSEVVHGNLIVLYRPNAPEVGDEVVCRMTSHDNVLGKLGRMEQILKILYGGGAFLAVDVTWDPVGTDFKPGITTMRRFVFDKPGPHSVRGTLEFRPYAPKSAGATGELLEQRLLMSGKREFIVEVVVEGDLPPALVIVPSEVLDAEPEIQYDFTVSVGGFDESVSQVTFKWVFVGETVEQESVQTLSQGQAQVVVSHAYPTNTVGLKLLQVSALPVGGTNTLTGAAELYFAEDTKDMDLDVVNQWKAASSGGYGITRNRWDISKLPEGAVFDIRFDARSVPDKFVIQYPSGNTVLDTGWRGQQSYVSANPGLYPGGLSGGGQGTVEGIFTKGTHDAFSVIVYGPGQGTRWNYSMRARWEPPSQPAEGE